MKINTEIFKNKINNIHEGKLKILGEYTKSNDKIECICLICNYKWFPRAKHLSSGHGCPKCVKCKRYTHKEFLEKLLNINENIFPLNTYLGISTPIEFKCKICEHIFKNSPYHVLNGQGCPKCSKRYKKTHDDFLQEISQIHKENITILGTYINARTPIKLKCNIDGNIWFNTPDKLINLKQKCPKCFYENNKGENHKNWNKFLTKEEREQKRNYPEYLKWRNEVYKKHNYTCFICNQKGGTLNAHHLDGYNWCKEKRIDIDNGITLCEKCHMYFHYLYGMKNNTREQFEEFENLNKENNI